MKQTASTVFLGICQTLNADGYNDGLSKQIKRKSVSAALVCAVDYRRAWEIIMFGRSNEKAPQEFVVGSYEGQTSKTYHPFRIR